MRKVWTFHEKYQENEIKANDFEFHNIYFMIMFTVNSFTFKLQRIWGRGVISVDDPCLFCTGKRLKFVCKKCSCIAETCKEKKTLDFSKTAVP